MRMSFIATWRWDPGRSQSSALRVARRTMPHALFPESCCGSSDVQRPSRSGSIQTMAQHRPAEEI